MAVIRGPKNKDFVVMCEHHLRNKNLSLKAIGLFSIILSLTDNWDYSIAGLSTITKDGIASVRSSLNELEANGYLTRKRIRLDDGKLEKSEYTFYEIPNNSTPEAEIPCQDLPCTAFPDTGERMQVFPDTVSHT